MGRPLKNKADYFPHQTRMRNDPKIQALRRKYGIEGYGLYNMLIEFLTDSEGFKWFRDDLSLEIMAGDFGVTPDRLSEITTYLIRLDLVQINEASEISCKTLEKQLEPLLSKREYDRNRVSGSYRNENDEESIVEESREKESIVKKSKGEERQISLSEFESLFDSIWLEQIQMVHRGKDIPQAIREAYMHLQTEKRLGRGEISDFKKCIQSFLSNKRPELNGHNGLSLGEKKAQERKDKGL